MKTFSINAGLNRIGFYTDQLYHFAEQNKKIKCVKSDNASLPMVIIGKEHCYECTKDLPIAKFEEAIKAARYMTNVAPFDGQTFFFVESLESGKTRIYFFTIKQSIFEHFSRHSLFVIPETLLVLSYLKKLTENNTIKTIRNNNEILVSLQKDGLISLFLRSNSEQTEQVLLNSLGKIKDDNVVDEVQYLSLLSKQLIGLPLYVYIQAFSISTIKSSISELPLKLLGLTGATIVSGYFILVSAWLYVQNNTVEEKLAIQQNALNDVFSLQASIDKESELLTQLSNNKKTSIVTAHVWPVLLELIRTDAEILSINYFDNQYTVRIKSPRSTDVVQFLSDNKATSSPEVTSAVVKSRGKEIITVKFSMIAKEALSEEGQVVGSNKLDDGVSHDAV